MDVINNRVNYVCCPVCKGELHFREAAIRCYGCSRHYDLQESIPVLITDENELFGRQDLTSMSSSGFHSKTLMNLGRFVPSPTCNHGEMRLWRTLTTALGSELKRCLIIGSGDDISIIEYMRSFFNEVVVTDVVHSPRVAYICDAAQLPFKASSFDCVIIMAVLEHVLDPATVVGEMHRVLCDGGIVVSSTPFMQQVHMRQFDFTRFTDLGHRWLFRRFVEVERGIAAGPASALVWSWIYFWRSFAPNRSAGLVLSTMMRLAFFWIKYIDFFLSKSRGACDASAGYYFIGKKEEGFSFSAKDLVASFRGL